MNSLKKDDILKSIEICNTLLQETNASWSLLENERQFIQVEFIFPGFPQCIAFMQDCVTYIEEINHHPEWQNVYNRLKISLTTHDAHNRITLLDIELARYLSEAFLIHSKA